MIKKIFISLVICLFFLLNITYASNHEKNPNMDCDPGISVCCNSSSRPCVDDGSYSCIYDKTINHPITNLPTNKYSCQKSPVGEKFGKITPPDPLKGFIKESPAGAWAISHFLSNLIILIYSIAAVVLVFMLIWGAFEWLTSGGDKEKIEAARKRIINAIIGMMLFAVAFAVIRVLGVFTGFKFFVGQ